MSPGPPRGHPAAREGTRSSIRKLLGLTTAEARLAEVLFTGVTLREAAPHLGVAVNTCKTQLKSIYAKTGCRGRTDLARVLAELTP